MINISRNFPAAVYVILYLRKNDYRNQEVPVGAAVEIIATVGHVFTKSRNIRRVEITKYLQK